MNQILLPNSFGIDPEDEAKVPTAHWTPDGWRLEMRDGSFKLQKFDAKPTSPIWTPDGLIDLRDGKLYDHMSKERKPYPIRGGAVGPAYTLQSTTVFAAPAAVHTFLMGISPAGHGLALCEWAISFDGVSASAVPVLVEVVSSTQAGAGTAGVSTVVTQIRGHVTTGSAPTMGGNYTAEPTTLVALRRYYVPAFMGTFVFQAPLGREPECDSSGGTVKALGIRITPPATVNAVGYMEVEANG